MLKFTAAVITAATLAVALAAAPAEAATKRKRQVVRTPTYQRVAVVRPRITVRKPRSYLDGGTEVLPGERKFNDYAEPLGYLARSPQDPYRAGDIQWNTSSWPPGSFRPGF